MSVLKRTESIVAFVLLLIAAAVLVTIFVVNNNDTEVVEGANPTAEEASVDGENERPNEPAAPNANAVSGG